MPWSAKIITASYCPRNPIDASELITYELRYPRMVHGEFLTHRKLSRSSSSSRAIPVRKIIDEVKNDPAFPARWGVNGKGMQDHGVMSPDEEAEATALWLAARDAAVEKAEEFLALPKVPHKQIVNRILEPFAHIRVVTTSTSFTNFFKLRNHPDADPTIQRLAELMQIEYNLLQEDRTRFGLKLAGDWHLPYVLPKEESLYKKEVLLQISTARCARVSYRTHDGQTPDADADIELYNRLVGSEPLHASPAEHQGTPDIYTFGSNSYQSPLLHGNFDGWIQHRKLLPGENGL